VLKGTVMYFNKLDYHCVCNFWGFLIEFSYAHQRCVLTFFVKFVKYVWMGHTNQWFADMIRLKEMQLKTKHYGFVFQSYCGLGNDVRKCVHWFNHSL